MKNLMFFDWAFASDSVMGFIVFLIVILGIVFAVEGNKDGGTSSDSRRDDDEYGGLC
jgi:glucose uptake protein GlcU